jgi:CHAT domain-containing protein
MAEFYRQWRGKRIPKAQALQVAQRSMLHKAKPHAWAGVILTGNWQ